MLTQFMGDRFVHRLLCKVTITYCVMFSKLWLIFVGFSNWLITYNGFSFMHHGFDLIYVLLAVFACGLTSLMVFLMLTLSHTREIYQKRSEKEQSETILVGFNLHKRSINQKTNPRTASNWSYSFLFQISVKFSFS